MSLSTVTREKAGNSKNYRCEKREGGNERPEYFKKITDVRKGGKIEKNYRCERNCELPYYSVINVQITGLL